ncbi:ParB/RepB/Spo0J family partition protein [Salinibacter altiplanensis]|uniref:ParB/RepB/Spo0J family partition protein n=1 Tax=Salinibacter altiplanensis TaxID=1803181 RepID=UPI000C9F5562|nr:ParB/RepB/Spo0J family partition protein [Salinibacter altiplanensis]
MGKKSALGKGLSALLPEEQDEQASEDGGHDTDEAPEEQNQLYQFEDGTRLLGRVAEVAVERIRPNPYQPRQEFAEEALDELAASIEQIGIIQPITVRALGDGEFEIISGERRLRAARRTGMEHLPAFIREADSEEMLEMALVENVQREELNPIEIALGYQRLVEECDLTQEEVAERVSKSRATVSNFLRLLRLPPRIQAALRDKQVSMGHARALIAMDDDEAQVALLEETIADDLSVREVERRARQWHADTDEDESVETAPSEEAPISETTPGRDDLQFEEFCNRLRSQFSTQVQIQHRKDGEGKIEISYYSEEDLNRLVELLADA